VAPDQAHRNLRELGSVDAEGRRLGERAARHLAAAARWRATTCRSRRVSSGARSVGSTRPIRRVPTSPSTGAARTAR